MKNFKTHGKAPFKIAVIHGGPGGAGGVHSLAKKLSKKAGVLEPLQTETSIDEQVEELKTVLQKNTDSSVTLIGHSWGAWLSAIFAAKYPDYVKKLILIASGPFETKYATDIMTTRMSRLNQEEKEKANHLIDILHNPNTSQEIGKLNKFITEMDSYDAISYEEEQTFNAKIFRKVWEQAEALRESGKLLHLCHNIKCPVVAIHGDYDPHPYQGVKEPLSNVIDNFKFILLEKCGHYPWLEKCARDRFYDCLIRETN